MRRMLAVMGVGAVLAFGACGDDEEQQPADSGGATTEQTDTGGAAAGGGTEPAGRQQFVETCGGCHTLDEAGTSGQVGPNLSELQPDREQVLSAIANGPGAMPENLLQGQDAENVADYVSSASGAS